MWMPYPLSKPNELNLKAEGEDKGSLQRENDIKWKNYEPYTALDPNP